MLRRATAFFLAGLVGAMLGTAAPAGVAAAQKAEARAEKAEAQAEAADDSDDDAPDNPSGAARGPMPTPKREGVYSGVNPAEPETSPSPKKVVKAGPSTLTWVGFAAQDSGGAQLFFQGTSRFAASQRLEGSILIVELEGLRKMATNTRRPLDTRFFESPVARVTAKAVRARKKGKKAPGRGAGIEVRVAFKNAADAREGDLRSATEADGTYTIYLDIAAAKSGG